MNHRLLLSLMCSTGLLFAGAARAEGADPCAIDTKVRADGTVELSNTGNTGKCDVAPAPRTAAVAAPVSARPAGSAASSASGTAAPADPAPAPQADAKDPRETYRDNMLAGAPDTTAANPAVSRRYKMMDKATYQATVLSGGSQGSGAGGAGSQ